MRSRAAHSLLELSIALTLFGMCAATVARPLQRVRDRIAVAAARRDLAAAVAATRSTAILAGGARLLIDPPSATVWTESAAGADLLSSRNLADRYGVVVETDRSVRLELRFDALGVGRMTGATIRLRRGEAVGQIIISSYGRVRQ